MEGIFLHGGSRICKSSKNHNRFQLLLQGNDGRNEDKDWSNISNISEILETV